MYAYIILFAVLFILWISVVTAEIIYESHHEYKHIQDLQRSNDKFSADIWISVGSEDSCTEYYTDFKLIEGSEEINSVTFTRSNRKL